MIINQKIPSFRLCENEMFYAFLDIRPISKGHSLVVPKVEVDRFFDMPDDYLKEILVFAKPVIQAIESVIPCQRVGTLVAGLEVPHAHLHCVPITEMSRFSFAYAQEADPGELKEVQALILGALKA